MLIYRLRRVFVIRKKRLRNFIMRKQFFCYARVLRENHVNFFKRLNGAQSYIFQIAYWSCYCVKSAQHAIIKTYGREISMAKSYSSCDRDFAVFGRLFMVEAFRDAFS